MQQIAWKVVCKHRHMFDFHLIKSNLQLQDTWLPSTSHTSLSITALILVSKKNTALISSAQMSLNNVIILAYWLPEAPSFFLPFSSLLGSAEIIFSSIQPFYPYYLSTRFCWDHFLINPAILSILSFFYFREMYFLPDLETQPDIYSLLNWKLSSTNNPI